MALLKEDGSLDIEWLNSLPIDEFVELYYGLTREQKEEYRAKGTMTLDEFCDYAYKLIDKYFPE